MERDPKFRNKDGSLTVYAFACGYIEKEFGEDYKGSNWVELYLDGLWHVRGFSEGVRFWYSFDMGNLRKARQLYRRLRSLKRKGKPFHSVEVNNNG